MRYVYYCHNVMVSLAQSAPEALSSRLYLHGWYTVCGGALEARTDITRPLFSSTTSFP